MDLTGQRWTIVLRQESFNVRFGVKAGLGDGGSLRPLCANSGLGGRALTRRCTTAEKPLCGALFALRYAC